MSNIFYSKFSEVSGDRLDPTYYANLGLYKGLDRLKTIVKVKGGKRIPKGKTFSSETTKYKYLRVEDIDAFGNINISKLKNISKEIYEELKRYKLNENEIVISNAGTIGKVTMLENFDEKIILTENCVKLVIHDNQILPKFLETMVRSNFIQTQFQNNYIKTTIPKLSVERISNTFFPKIPSFEIQNKIVSKMEQVHQQKQQKEQEAQKKLESIDSYLLNALGIELPREREESLEDRVFFRKFSDVSGDRIDGKAHHSKRTKTINGVKLSKYPIKSLKNLSSFSKEITLTNSKKLPYIGLENIESNTGVYYPSTEKESFSSAVKFKKGQILFPKLRPYLNKVYFAEFDGLCSTEFHILDSDIVNNQYLDIFLRSTIIVNQTKYLMSGNTLPRLQTEDIKNLLIVVPPSEIQDKMVRHISTLKDEAQALKKEATEIYNSAKLEVEKMILDV